MFDDATRHPDALFPTGFANSVKPLSVSEAVEEFIPLYGLTLPPVQKRPSYGPTGFGTTLFR